jgi:hypothetical protein
MLDRKRLAFGVIFGAILLAVTVGGIEFLVSLYAPTWPARALRSVPPSNPVTATTEPFSEQPWMAAPYNSWGMRDTEHALAKPANGAPRVVFVGDSFVESSFTPLSLPAAVRRQVEAVGGRIEAINLGVSATNPRSYYYRTRDVALELSPDVLLLFIYAGNDFMAADGGYSPWPPVVDESPGGSLLGTIMPRTNWLLINRLRLSELLRGTAALPGEIKMLFDDLHAPPGERTGRFVAHVKKYYYPDLPEEKIREVLSRGDDRLWRQAERNPDEQEYLMGYMLNILINWETREFEVAKSRQDAARLAGNGEVEATASWIEATDRLLRSHGIPLLVFLVPVGSVDPAYADFWKPWPRAYSWNYICDERGTRLASTLSKSGIRYVDLRENLANIPGTYRKLDGHWSQKGEAIVADRVALELKSLLPSPSVGIQMKAGGSSPR